MGLEFHRIFHRRQTRKMSCILSRVFLIAGVMALIAWMLPAASAQEKSSPATNVSDLALQNLSRVAASAVEIEAVLSKNTGLMVELKHWVARDATEHGQVVIDADLTDDGIFSRLDTDVQFRSIATTLVQKYGYLLPTINPDSDSGKERELLIRQRVQRLAEKQDEDLAVTQQRGVATPRSAVLPRASSVGPSSGAPSFEAPPEPESPVAPGRDASPLLRAQTLPSAAETSGLSSSLSFPGSSEDTESFANLNVSASEALSPQSAGLVGRPSGTSLSSENSNSASRDEALLASTGMDRSAAGGGSPSLNGTGRAQDIPWDSRGDSFAATARPRVSSAALSEPPEMIHKQTPYASIPSLYDMNMQAVARPAAPRRFGADIFQNGTRDAQSIPMDLPAGPDYIVGPGDGLSVDLWGGVSQRLYRVVDREGRVSLPEVGPILVSGKSLADVQQNLQQILRTQFRDVSADVSLARLRNKKTAHLIEQ